MRVLIVVGSLARGGAERQAILTCGALRTQRVQTALFVLQPPLDLIDEIAGSSDLLHDAPERRPRAAQQVAALSRALSDVDAVVSFMPSAHLRVLLARRSSPRARRATWLAAERGNMRLDHFVAHPMTSTLRLAALHEADRVLVNSPALAGNVAAFAGGLGQKIVVIPNILPNATAVGDSDPRARALSLVGGEVTGPLVGSIGSFQPDRNYELLADAFAHVVRVEPRAHLLICGRTDGALCSPSATRVRARLDEMKLSSRVTLAGDVPRARELLPAFDAFVLPSLLEGSSNALAEALIAGTAIATTPVGDAEALAGGAARIAGGWTARELAQAIQDVIREPGAWRARARSRGATLQVERAPAQMGARWLDVIEDAAEARRNESVA